MKVFKHQGWHILLLSVLLVLVLLAVSKDSGIVEGHLWKINSGTWLWLAILAPVAHQIYVAFCWRYELYYQGITRLLGERGFKIYKVGFAILIFSRVVFIVLLAIANAGTLKLPFILAVIFAVPALMLSAYLFYSVFNYFGIDNAFGVDHFKPDEVRDQPMVQQGIFKYTSNGMYVFGFLLLWVPGLLALSKAALLAAIFNHIYIWVHYYFTELPDMKEIYSAKN